MRVGTVVVAAVAGLSFPSMVHAAEFEANSIIIPMDVDYQDMGMLEAFGLVYQLLLADVPVQWVIEADKDFQGVDFTASATDYATNAAIDNHGYRGGPWVVDSADADAAMVVIDAWQMDHPNTAVHVASGPFEGDVAYYLVSAPTIAMVADGNQKIARTYMQAAGIPDSTGDLAWADDSPDMLTPDELAGTMDEAHSDGALFDEDGDPVYCQLMSMHWAVNDAEDNPEVVAEVRSYLGFATHFFAECQAVNAFENLDPHGFYLTPNGFEIGDGPNEYDYYQFEQPFVQFDGPFESVGGSEPAYTLPPGDSYKESDIVMITEQGTPVGVNDVWMTGFLDGICPGNALLYPDGELVPGGGLWIDPGLAESCLTAGKVSYLGGHQYDTDLPISQNPKTQGARLFLNSLFEAPCATSVGQPVISLDKSAPVITDDPEVTFTIDYSNDEGVTALNAVLTDQLGPGMTFVSASDGGELIGDTVQWELGNLGAFQGGSVTLTVMLEEFGVYDNVAELDYTVGLSGKSMASNETETEFVEELPSDDTSDEGTADTSGDADTGDTGGTGESTSGDGGSEGGTDGGSGDEGGGDGADEVGTDETADGGVAGETLDRGCGCTAGGGAGSAGLFGLLLVCGLRRRSRAALTG